MSEINWVLGRQEGFSSRRVQSWGDRVRCGSRILFCRAKGFGVVVCSWEQFFDGTRGRGIRYLGVFFLGYMYYGGFRQFGGDGISFFFRVGVGFFVFLSLFSSGYVFFFAFGFVVWFWEENENIDFIYLGNNMGVGMGRVDFMETVGRVGQVWGQSSGVLFLSSFVLRLTWIDLRFFLVLEFIRGGRRGCVN